MTEWTLPFNQTSTGKGFLYPFQVFAENNLPAMNSEEFVQVLKSQVDSYHTTHPFQISMIEGTLSKDQMRGWIKNRFYYQLVLPRKDGAILASCPDRTVRRKWIKRIESQDGKEHREGGIEQWLELGLSAGISRAEMLSLDSLLPAVRFSCDSYLNFVKSSPWQEGVCSSLTELFAGDAHRKRIEIFPKKYPWIEGNGLSYFKNRIPICEEDSKCGLEVTLQYFNTRALQERACQILKFKLDILWTMLDAIQLNYCGNLK